MYFFLTFIYLSLYKFKICFFFVLFYRTTIMSNGFNIPRERPSNLVIQPYVDNLEIQNNFSRLNSSQSSFSRTNRREIYLKELQTHPPPSGGRYRECSPEFYRLYIFIYFFK